MVFYRNVKQKLRLKPAAVPGRIFRCIHYEYHISIHFSPEWGFLKFRLRIYKRYTKFSIGKYKVIQVATLYNSLKVPA